MKNIVNKKNIILVASFVFLAVISFFAGTSYTKSKKTVNLQNDFSQFGQMGQIRGMRGGQLGRMISGEILSKDDQSITIKNRDGGSKIIFYTNKTTVSKMADGSIDDLIVGKEVNIQGTTNPDGSVNAQSISIRPVNINKTISN